jgi:transmembrane sensor
MIDTNESRPGGQPKVPRLALEWLAKKDRGLTQAETTQFTLWLAADPAHRAEFAIAEAAWRRMDALADIPVLEAEAEILFARAQRRRRRNWFALSAATLAAAASLAVAFFTAGPTEREERSATLAKAPLPVSSFNTLDGSARVQELPDGSVVELNGDSLIEVDFTPTHRNVRLLRGEAHFTVAKNPERPFWVSNRTVAVRAVGTAFNVRVESAQVDVIVTEGVVSLTEQADGKERGTAPKAAAGTRAIIALDEPGPATGWRLSEPSQEEIEQILAWRSPRLTFESTPLGEVITAFNQQNRHQLRLGDPTLEARTLTGSFRANNLPGFIRLLQSTLGVEAERISDDETVLRPAR